MIRNIVFDIGWVFVHLQPAPLIRLLTARGAGELTLEQVTSRIQLEEHESGRLNGSGLLENLAALSPDPIDHDELHSKWTDMFALDVSMVDLAHRLSERYRVYLLSNVGDLHWSHLCREYGLHRIGHGALPSFVAGVMKPFAGIYEQAERRFGLKADDTLFVDDRPENVQAARARGWHGIIHKSVADTRRGLELLDVRAA